MSEPIRLAPHEAKAILKAKNWSISNLALYWGKSRETVSRLVSDWKRPQQWNDAILGLPTLNKLEARTRTVERLEKNPPKKRSRKVEHAKPKRVAHYDIGAILVATDHIGSIADSGDEGLVINVMLGSTEYFYKIEWPGGTDLYPESDIEHLVADTGRTGIIRDE